MSETAQSRAEAIRAEIFAESAVRMERRQRAYMITGTCAIAREDREDGEGGPCPPQRPPAGLSHRDPEVIAARIASKNARAEIMNARRVESREPCKRCAVRGDRHADEGCARYCP